LECGLPPLWIGMVQITRITVERNRRRGGPSVRRTTPGTRPERAGAIRGASGTLQHQHAGLTEQDRDRGSLLCAGAVRILKVPDCPHHSITLIIGKTTRQHERYSEEPSVGA
jgi:hypothetical protein